MTSVLDAAAGRVVELAPIPVRRPLFTTMRAPMAGVLVVAGVLRLLWLDSAGFNSDEAVYAGQAASIAGDTVLQPYFPIFRAHPLAFQSALSLLYLDGTSDIAGRRLAVAVGMLTVVAVYLVGRELYGRSTGLLAAALIAVMPYQVVVSRQVLLDGALALWGTVALFLLARYARTGSRGWLIASGGALGLAVLSKETAILLTGSVYAFVALRRELGTRLRDLLWTSLAFALVVVPFPLSLIFADSRKTGSNFLAWQIFRRPNHGWTFYFTEVPPALGYAVVVLAVVWLTAVWRQRTWRESLLLCWILVPLCFFEFWTVKGFQYLLPIASPVAVLAARGLIHLPVLLRRRPLLARLTTALAVVAIVGTTVLPSWTRIQPPTGQTFLAGSGGVPGGREAGHWVAANVPVGAELLALGPSMANIVQFYGHRRAYGLSVSPNPLNRNPTYTPVPNADLAIRRNEIQYLVWDSYSASRSPFFGQRLQRYAERYHGRAVFTHTVPVQVDGQQTVQKPVVIIYEVRP